MVLCFEHVVRDGNALRRRLNADLLQDLDHAARHRFRLSLRVDTVKANAMNFRPTG
jgi:hypothetical protein